MIGAIRQAGRLFEDDLAVVRHQDDAGKGVGGDCLVDARGQGGDQGRIRQPRRRQVGGRRRQSDAQAGDFRRRAPIHGQGEARVVVVGLSRDQGGDARRFAGLDADQCKAAGHLAELRQAAGSRGGIW